MDFAESEPLVTRETKGMGHSMVPHLRRGGPIVMDPIVWHLHNPRTPPPQSNSLLALGRQYRHYSYLRRRRCRLRSRSENIFPAPLQWSRRMHMQHGSLTTESRLEAPDVWQFRRSEKGPHGTQSRSIPTLKSSMWRAVKVSSQTATITNC
jgi:hypothetical protein